MIDQYYTTPETAEKCVAFFRERTRNLFVAGGVQYVEPSAGAGDFLACLPAGTLAMDTAPQNTRITKQDFFSFAGPPDTHRDNVAVIGNPPFGRRGRLALDFCVHASQFASTIGFILPMCFAKYATQKHFPQGYKLVGEMPCEKDAFYTPDGKPYNVGAVFQIWTSLETRLKDSRILAPPPIAHPDFELRQYNNTRQAEKVFALPFDFAVPCQGYQDYARREKNSAGCERNKQWMLFANCASKAREVLWNIDFAQLAHMASTVTPGFRKHDVVREYANVAG